MLFGFSTGAIALGDFDLAIDLCRRQNVEAIEISALRESELPTLVAAVNRLDLSSFKAVSYHAPSRRTLMSEVELIDLLETLSSGSSTVVVHPDIMVNVKAWRTFGSCLSLENMDKRKPVGRNVEELSGFFDDLPDAKICVDLAHARQVDPSMSVASEILQAFRGRLTHLHVSDVTSSSRHEPLSMAAISAFSTVAHLVPNHVVVILESTFGSVDVCLRSEIDAARRIFQPVTVAV